MPKIQLPKDALSRIDIGKAFAEHDILARNPSLFVRTPASIAAFDRSNRKSFFVGRRGTGKTAIALELGRTYKRSISIIPEVFDLITLPLPHADFADTKQRPFKSLTSAFERAIIGELVFCWIRDHRMTWEQAGDAMRRERGLIESCDFDLRVLNLSEEIFSAYQTHNDKLWLRQIRRSKDLVDEIDELANDGNFCYALIIDRLDEAWSGSDSSIIALMALMHAITKLTASCTALRPFLFIRENIYERIRQRDNEFSRLETSVVFLDWSKEKLLELIERRLVQPFSTRPKLGGEAWSHFFLEDESCSASSIIFASAQLRPRDIIILCSFALESAVNRNHLLVDRDDLKAASERYSVSRLKELGDEYAENYPNIRIVLGFFYGLTEEFTLRALDELIQRLLVEQKIKDHCAGWFYSHAPPHLFVGVLYGIGFLGIRRGGKISFREAVTDPAFMPKVDNESTFVIHPTYSEALNLKHGVLTELPREIAIKEEGILDDIPTGFTFDGYQQRLKEALQKIQKLPEGDDAAERFEEVVGEIIKLCFFRSLTNVERRVRSQDGRTIKDWVASNQAFSGFWAMVREKHGATQIIWECKNYSKLSASDFHQAAYYMNATIGKFALITFRGKEVTHTYYEHIERLAHKDRKGLIIVLRQSDLEVFLRQAIKGTPKETHISELYDKTVRAIS